MHLNRARGTYLPYQLAALLGAAICALLAAPAFAAEVVRVEEDWELVVASTDSNSTAPQVTTAISPVGSVDGLHATFELNHQSVPDWAPGGVHLVPWDGEYYQDVHKFPKGEVMDGGGEVVRWTQVMKLSGSTLTFSIQDGTSQTWGAFGGQGYLRSSVDVTLDNLGGYDPAVSVANSGVTYAGNRVTSLVLKRVRRVLSNGQVHVDETDRVAHSNN